MTAPAGITQPGERHEGSGRPLWQHALVLLVLLLALIPVVGTSSAVNTDESFVVIQVNTLEETGKWTLPHPFPEVDPSGNAFPLHGATRYPSGYTLYDKHPALIYLYRPIDRLLGVPGLIGLSVLGTWGAAVVAARLAERLRRGSGVAALWMVGVASPLFFDAYQVHAHTIAAALAGLVALLTLRAFDERRVWLSAAATITAVGVVLLRTEGALFVGAVGGAAGLMGLLGRRMRPVLLGALLIGIAGATRYLERAWYLAIADGPVLALASLSATESYLAGRITSLSYTLLMPGYRGGTVPEMITIIGAAMLVAGAVLMRRRSEDQGAVLVLIVGSVILLVRSLLEWGPVPGLLVAFCVGFAGLSLLGGEVARSTWTRFLLLGAGTYGLAVVVTQYAGGGHTEWGGRYFALGLPLLGAVAAGSLSQGLSVLPRSRAKTLRACVLVASAAMAVLAVSTLRAAHDRNQARTDGVLAAAAELPPAPDDSTPVVLTEDEQVPRLSRGRYDEARFLRVDSAEISRFLERLAGEGITDVLLVSKEPARSLGDVPSSWEVVGAVTSHDLQYEGGGGLIRLRLVGG